MRQGTVGMQMSAERHCVHCTCLYLSNRPGLCSVNHAQGLLCTENMPVSLFTGLNQTLATRQSFHSLC